MADRCQTNYPKKCRNRAVDGVFCEACKKESQNRLKAAKVIMGGILKQAVESRGTPESESK